MAWSCEEQLKAMMHGPGNNGSAILIPRMIFGRRVMSVVHITPMEHLDALREIVRILAQNIGKGRPLRIVEVGSWVGESAIALQAGFGLGGGTVYCIDHFQGNDNDYLGGASKTLTPEAIKTWFIKNTVDLFGNTIRLSEGKSLEVAEERDPQEADLVFLDAEHDYDSVTLISGVGTTSPIGYLIGQLSRSFQVCDKQLIIMSDAGMPVHSIAGVDLINGRVPKSKETIKGNR